MGGDPHHLAGRLAGRCTARALFAAGSGRGLFAAGGSGGLLGIQLFLPVRVQSCRVAGGAVQQHRAILDVQNGHAVHVQCAGIHAVQGHLLCRGRRLEGIKFRLLHGHIPHAVGGVKAKNKCSIVAGSRTVLAYLAADHRGTLNNLSSLALLDLEEMRLGMAKVNNSSNMRLLVYIDTDSSPRLIELKNEGGKLQETTVKTYENRNSVGVAETLEVFNDVFKNSEYRAESYGLIYWSHGDGWIPNPLPSTRWVGQDTGSGTHYMNIEDLVTILSADAVPHFDFVLFDACFMQSIEVAYALRNFTDYYIGSPTEIPGPGARYDVLVPALFSDGEVALKVAAAYYEPYKKIYNGGSGISNTNWTGGVSVCALQSSVLESLASITKQVLSENADSEELRSLVFNYDQRRESSNIGYYDFVQLMQQLTDASGFATWKQVYDMAVPYWETTSKNYSGYTGMFSMEGSSGVSHYIPSLSKQAAAAAFRSTDWYKSAGLSKLGW